MKSEVNTLTDYLTSTCQLPPYLAYPRFLLDMDISETAKLVYAVLLDRARLSLQNEGWTDKAGHVFLYFTISNLAATLHKSEMTIKTALKGANAPPRSASAVPVIIFSSG